MRLVPKHLSMNILCLGYQDKFSRFYILISKALKHDGVNHSIYIHSYFLSGYLFSVLRFYRSSLMSYHALFKSLTNKKKYDKIVKNNNTYKGIHLEDVIQFNLNYNPKTPKQKLKRLAVAYIEIYSRFFDTKKPDLIVSLGDSRMPFEIALHIAKTKKIKIYYIEQGPFNTTVFDETGVNANASLLSKYNNFKNKIQNPLDIINNEPIIDKSNDTYLRLPFLRGLDYLLEFLFNKSPFFPIDLYKEGSKNRVKQKQIGKIDTNSKKTYLLALQVPFDVNMIYHSPLFKNHFAMIQSVYKNLPKNTHLILREHPVYKGKYNKNIYEFVKRSKHISIDNETSLEDLFNSISALIVNNSTMGIEAIFRGLKVLVLGNAYYTHENLCIKLNRIEDLKNNLEKISEFEINKTEIKTFQYFCMNSYFIQGTISDRNNIAAKLIATKISMN